MTRVLENVDVKIVPRVGADGRPFSELLHTWVENGKEQFALSRTWWTHVDSSHARAVEIQAFKRRQAK